MLVGVRRLIRGVFFAGLVLAGACFAGESVICHYTYGGETKSLRAEAVRSGYTVDSIAVGSYFRFRVVFRNQPADLAAIKVYTYADRDDGVVLIHQSTYPYPPRPSKNSPYGFSGLHHVYEPVRDGELQYWCEWRAGGGAS